jgi:hypothetical protein
MIPLSTMTALWATTALAEQAPDPADVKPGWLGFGVFLLLAAAVVVLWFSFRKQLRKVDFEEKGQENPEESGASENGETDGGAEGR